MKSLNELFNNNEIILENANIYVFHFKDFLKQIEEIEELEFETFIEYEQKGDIRESIFKKYLQQSQKIVQAIENEYLDRIGKDIFFDISHDRIIIVSKTDLDSLLNQVNIIFSKINDNVIIAEIVGKNTVFSKKLHQEFKNKNLNPSKFKITDSKISELNQLLSSRTNNLEDFFMKLSQLLENGKKIYLKYGRTPQEKEKILVMILENIIKLINKLNIKRVHNTTESLNIENGKFRSLKQLENFFRIRGRSFLNHNKKGFSCHVLNFYIQGLIKEITNNDSDIQYIFELNKIDNHGKLIFSINGNYYIFDSIEEGVKLKKTKELNSSIKEYFQNTKEYIEKATIGNLSKNSLTYHYGRFRFKLYKIGTNTYFSFHTKPIRKLNIRGFKRASKYIQLLIKMRKIGKVNSIKELKNKIFNKVDRKYHKVIEQIFSNLNEQGLEKFLTKK